MEPALNTRAECNTYTTCEPHGVARWVGSAQTWLSGTLHRSQYVLAAWEPGQVVPWAVIYQHCTPGHLESRGAPGPSEPEARPHVPSSRQSPHCALVTCHTLSWCSAHVTQRPPTSQDTSTLSPILKAGPPRQRPHPSAGGHSQSSTSSRGRLFALYTVQTALGFQASLPTCPRQRELAPQHVRPVSKPRLCTV